MLPLSAPRVSLVARGKPKPEENGTIVEDKRFWQIGEDIQRESTTIQFEAAVDLDLTTREYGSAI
jgi:hypothetical protein